MNEALLKKTKPHTPFLSPPEFLHHVVTAVLTRGSSIFLGEADFIFLPCNSGHVLWFTKPQIPETHHHAGDLNVLLSTEHMTINSYEVWSCVSYVDIEIFTLK